MEFPLSLVKNAEGSLDGAWVASLVRGLGLRGFVETGTYLGHSLENVCALFDRAVSIELSEQLHAAAIQKFADRPNVTLLQGDSAHRIVDAQELCRGLPTLYWLDAHWSAGTTARGGENTPILAELALIAGRVSPGDVVLIDDMRQFVSIPDGFARHDANDGYPTVDQVLEVLVRFPGGGFEALLTGDVLVCMSLERRQLLRPTPAVQAITALRAEPHMSAQQRQMFEQQVAAARGEEREVLLTLPEHYKGSLQYGLGGDFCYWRALVREADMDYVGALADLELARRCNVNVPPRVWEGGSAGARWKRAAARVVRLGRGPAEMKRRGGAPA